MGLRSSIIIRSPSWTISCLTAGNQLQFEFSLQAPNGCYAKLLVILGRIPDGDHFLVNSELCTVIVRIPLDVNKASVGSE